jgi:hypothetical protein
MIVRELITKIGFTVDASKLEAANKRVGDFKNRVNGFNGNLKQMATDVRNFGAGMTAAITLPIIGLGLAAVKSSADIEMLTTDFETLLGSAEKGAEMVQNIRSMAARTPFGTNDLAKASRTLLAFGVDAENTLPILSRIGDVATGNKERMKSLALVYGQVEAAQRLMGQDLLQFINAGFNPLLIISEKTGESMKSLKDRMSNGEIGIDQVKQAFIDATSEGGRFYKGMERGSKTLQGRLSTLKDVFLELLASFGDIALPVMKSLTNVLIKMAEWMTKLPKPVKILIGVLAGLAAVIGPLLLIVGQLAISFMAIAPLLPAIGAGIAAIAGPVGWAVLAIGALTVAGVLLVKKWEPVKNFFTILGAIIGGIVDKIKTFSKYAKFLGYEVIGADVGFKDNFSKNESFNVGSAFIQSSKQPSSRTTQNINMKLDSKVEMPVGTPAEIESYANTTVKKTVQKTFEEMLRQTDANVSFAGGIS